MSQEFININVSRVYESFKYLNIEYMDLEREMKWKWYVLKMINHVKIIIIDCCLQEYEKNRVCSTSSSPLN